MGALWLAVYSQLTQLGSIDTTHRSGTGPDRELTQISARADCLCQGELGLSVDFQSSLSESHQLRKGQHCGPEEQQHVRYESSSRYDIFFLLRRL